MQASANLEIKRNEVILVSTFAGMFIAQASFRISAFHWPAVRNGVMAGGRIALADVRCVAIDTDKRSVFIDHPEFLIQVLTQALLVMTFSAAGDRHVRLQPSECGRLRNVDMAGRALGDMVLLFTAAFMAEFHGNAKRLDDMHVGRRR